MNESSRKEILIQVYKRLYTRFGPQHWWPGNSQFEIIVGAILTQNTNWGNVEKAIKNLKRARVLSPKGLIEIPVKKLAKLIRPSGYFNIKAKRLKNFIEFLFKEYQGDLKKMEQQPLTELRQKLLSVNGIGPETADSILLYAFEKPIFVVDAYTKRLLYRHHLIDEDDDYSSVQKIFMGHLKADVKFFNEYHALIVRLGKEICKKKPLCHLCPLNNLSYSLIFKCSSCHRYLLNQEERFPLKRGEGFLLQYFCPRCFKGE